MTFEGFEQETWEALPGAARLTMAQREAIESDAPLLSVVAGAGAGKTRVLTLRVARRVRDGSIDADRTLVTTFSRKAAEELRTRLWSLGVSGVRAGTFHRTALGLLRQHRELRGRPAPQLLPDRRRLIADVTTGDPRRTRALEGEIGWAKARLVPPDHYEAEARRHRRRSGVSHEQVAETYARYEAERTKRRLLDFDDLIGACGDALAGDSDFADRIRWRSRHLFVDEMQDVNPAQFRLLTALLSDEPDLFVVGDPNQSVYGFNGADPTLLDRLPEILRGTKVIRLDENHRCTPQVVAVATAVLRDGASGDVVPPSTTRVDGPVPQVVRHDTDHDEAAWAASRAKLSRTRVGSGRASPCWRAPTPSWPRCKPPWTPPACPAWWPAPIWGRPVTCAPRGPPGARGRRGRTAGAFTLGAGPGGADHVPPRQGPAMADGPGARSRSGPHADRVGPDDGRRRGGAPAPVRGADAFRGGAVV